MSVKRKIDSAMMVEGVSSQAKNFHKLLKKINRMHPSRLLILATQISESVFVCPVVESQLSGELSEIARGSMYRAVKVRLPTADGGVSIFSFVVPLSDFSGEEITDAKALSSIQSALDEIQKGILDDEPHADRALSTVYKDPEIALAKLRELESDVSFGFEDDESIVNPIGNGNDPRKFVIQFQQFLDLDDKTTEMIQSMTPADMEAAINSDIWSSVKTQFNQAAAGIITSSEVEDFESAELMRTLSALAIAIILSSYAAYMVEQKDQFKPTD